MITTKRHGRGVKILRRLIAAACLVGTVGTSAAQARRADHPQLWMTVMEPIWRQIEGWPPSDFDRLVDAGEWPNTLKHLQAFQFTEKYAARGELSQIKDLIRLLQSHGVKIAIQGVPLIASTKCGLGVESYGTKDETRIAATRLRDAGAQISYIVFDEPLYFGHFLSDKAWGCKLSVQHVLDQVVERDADLRRAFPGVKIGDVEPFGLNDVSAADWSPAYRGWLAGYARLTGHNWDFVQIDAVWSRPQWKSQFLASLPAIKEYKIPYGIFYTGSPSDHSDAQWAASIREDARIFEGEMGMRPQHGIVASWTDLPRHLVPETNSDTMTGVALRYIQARESGKGD